MSVRIAGALIITLIGLAIVVIGSQTLQGYDWRPLPSFREDVAGNRDFLNLSLPGPSDGTTGISLWRISSQNTKLNSVTGENRSENNFANFSQPIVYEGIVTNTTGSRVSIYLGAVWVYGTVEMPGWIGHIRPIKQPNGAEGQYIWMGACRGGIRIELFSGRGRL